ESAVEKTPLLEGAAFAREIKITADAIDLTPYTLSATIDGAEYRLGDPYPVDGPHTLVVNGVDGANNHSEPITIKFAIDRSAPEVLLRESGQPFPAGKTFTRDIIATITYQSATTPAIDAKIDGQTYTLGQPYAPEGRHEIVVVVTNAAGLSTTVKAAFTIDKTPPTIQLFANDQPWTPDQKYSADVKVTVRAQDNLATAPKTKILLDEQEILDGYVITREAFHEIVAHVTDDGGLTGQSGPFKFVLDKTKPVVRIKVDGEPLESGDKFNHAITPEITIEDLTLTTFTATLNGQTYEKGAKIETDAKYTLLISVKDDLGFTTTLDPIAFIVDKTPPVVLVKENNVRFEGGQFDRDVTPIVDVQDLTETTITATVDGRIWTSGTAITEEGDHVLKVTVTDELEWSYVVPPISFTVDKSKPVVLITERGEELLDGRIFNRDAQPKITVTDTTAPATVITLNGQPFASEQLVTAEQKHVLKVTATDALNHVTDVPPITFTVDKTPPALALTENGSPLVNGAILNHDVTPHLAVSDLTTYTTVAKLDGNDFQLDTPVTAEGAHVLDIAVTDAAQWKSTIPNLGFFIDKTPPQVTVSADNKVMKSGDEFGAAITPKIDIVDISATTIAATLDGAPYVPGTPITAEGNHTLVVSVTDAAKWKTDVPPIAFAIDMSAPVVTVTEHNVPFESGTKFNRDVEPKIVVTDLTKTTIDAKLTSPNSVQTYAVDSIISTEGNHTLTISVTDNLGHVTVVPPISFLVDKTAPVVKVVAAGREIQSGDAFLNSVKPEILVTDVSKTTVDAKINGQPFVSGLEITHEGKYTLTVTVTDEVGWATTVPPIDFYVDATAPEVKLVDQDGEELKNDSWYAADVTPRAIVTDTTTTRTTATLTSATANGPQPFDMGTKITAEGTYTLAVKVTDAVGLFTEVPPVTFHIDKTPPAITFISPVANSTIGTREVVVTGASDDAISVFVNGAESVIDPVAKKYTSPPIGLLEGPNVISAVAHDRAGNRSEPSITVTLDTRAPEITITSPAEGACLDVTTLEVKGTAFGGVSAIKVTAGNAAPVNATISSDGLAWTATIPTPNEGRLALAIEASDAGGHTSTILRTVTIDRTKPVIEVTEGGVAFEAALIRRPVALNVRAKDADGKAALTVTLDDAPYVSGTLIEAEGTHTLKAKATDCAGHTSDEKVVTFRIDRTPPVLSNLAPAHGSTIGNKPPITGVVSEPATIVAEGTPFAATLNGNNFSIAATLEEGLNEFVLLATDAAGNQSRVPHAFTVQTTAPTVEIVENGSPIAANALFNRNVTPVIRASDPKATINATKNGAPFTSGTAITEDGSYTITAKATDAFGHESATATATFRIDKTPPAIRITEPADGMKLATATITVRGTVSADARVVSVNGVAATLPGDGTFTATITLDGSDNAIVAFAADEAGNSASDVANVTFEGGTLALILTSPADKMLTNRPHVVVAGQIITPSDAESLTINGQAASFDAAGSFLVPDFLLGEGDNPITAAVKKKGGQSSSITVTVKADFTPPALKVLANSVELAAGARFASSPAIVLEANDNNPGVTTKLMIDGTTITGAVPSLADGGHSLTAIARDAAGNETRIDRTFFIGGSTVTTGCGLSNIDPVEATSLYDATIRITGRAGGAAAVLINGARADVSDGSFCGTATLAPGRNEITIQCANADGTPTTDTPVKVVYYRYTDPTITIATPSSGAAVTNPKIIVTGTVGAGVVEGHVNGIDFTVPDDGASSHNFSVADVTLAPGLNVIRARAETTSHRSGVATVHVKLLNAAPQIALTSPLPGTQTGANAVDVSGTYANVDPSTITISAGGASISAATHPLTDTTGTFTLASLNLANGVKSTITATGRNAAGVVATSSADVEQIATAPQITITSPADNTFLANTVTGKITVTGTIANAENASVQVNGVAATMNGASFTAGVDQTTTAGGSTILLARVTLSDGRVATDVVRVFRFAAALTVKDTFPSKDATEVDPAVLVL
ncbi:MAG TPA: hypothetical protein VMU84_08330, partial [Thermoanaerobaculia bacterium]|nr:hypothetical protein [Thermoanaerobaculia bacterium]